MRESVLFMIILGLTGMLFFSASIGPGKDQGVDATSGATQKISKTANSLYHRTEEKAFQMGEVVIQGEVLKPGLIDVSRFYPRDVFVKEMLLNERNEPSFLGAFRYVGYSLFDLLNEHALEKKNVEVFRPAIDAYVIISNDKGESVSFSWSEIFHTLTPHQIILATSVAPIKPYRKEVEYETGTHWRVIAANDLFSYRNLDNPSLITVVSFNEKDFPITRYMDPMYSPGIDVVMNNQTLFHIPQAMDGSTSLKYHTSFYGMGMGYHPNPEFNGISLPVLMREAVNVFDPQWLQHGLACFAAVDGYRAVFSYSELFNRVDQVIPILSVPEEVNKGGYYRIFLPTDFYADRSVKSVKEIYFFQKFPR